jgi:hypothetical protein
MMQAVHDMAEERRRTNDILKECKDAWLACKSTIAAAILRDKLCARIFEGPLA